MEDDRKKCKVTFENPTEVHYWELKDGIWSLVRTERIPDETY